MDTAEDQKAAGLDRMPPSRRIRVLEGRSRLDPRRIGSLVGIAGGLVFAIDYGSFLSAPLRITTVAVAVALALGAVLALFGRPRALGAPHTLSNRAWLIYLASVAGMLALIAVGRWGVTALGHAPAAPAVIVFAVGVHLLPFAAAFGERHFRDLGATLAVIGVLGLALAILAGSPFGAGAAVVAGLVMLGLMLAYALRGRALSVR